MEILHVNSNYLTSKLHENLLDEITTINNEIANTIIMPIKAETKKKILYTSKYKIYTPIAFNKFDRYVFTFKQYKIYKQVLKLVTLNKYNLIHAHTLFHDGDIAYKIKKEYHIPYVVTVRGSTDIDNFFKKRFYLRRKGLEILKEATNIIFLSNGTRQRLIDDYVRENKLKTEILKKSVILPNGIDDFWFENCGSVKNEINKSAIKFIQVGKVYERKNVLGSIEGIKEFNKRHNANSELTVIGSIEDSKYAKKISEEKELKINMIPAKPREWLVNEYRKNDIYITPSIQETFGLVYPEAMSQGLPVIYTKNQGFDKQFPDGEVGYPVDPHNPHDIADKIELILQNYENISTNSLKNFKVFDWEELSKEFIKIYKNILG